VASKQKKRAKRQPLPISPALQEIAPVRRPATLADRRLLVICILAMVLGLMAAGVSQILLILIQLCTNIAFFGRFTLENQSPADNHLGALVVLVPVIGGLIVGIMARFGSQAIRGHGIPEAMEQVLTNESRIPARIVWLKPLSAAISIGTGGPFGAEGPIIATGGALGSLAGQLLHVSAAERKTLLAAGAAAGMSATFGSPVSAVLLACELLLFEWRPRSLVPVALASAVAAAARTALEGGAEPVFPLPGSLPATGGMLAAYVLLGLVAGMASVLVTRAVYGVEDAFQRLPVHWMWWPALGAIAVGAIGYMAPHTLGVGYGNITHLLSGEVGIQAAAFLCSMKFVSWCISLGSGTSGGTLAPLLTIGGGLGVVWGQAMRLMLPGVGVDLRIAALVGMAGMFAGASRAWMASVVFGFEATQQPLALLPLLGGCAAAYFASCYLMSQSIMTEKIARRGVRPPHEYLADVLDQVLVRQIASARLVTISGSTTLRGARSWLAQNKPDTLHQGFPVVDANGRLLGIVTRKDLSIAADDDSRTVAQLLRRPPIVVFDDCTVREAVDHMLNHDVGRLPVIRRAPLGGLVGMVTRGDVLGVYRKQLADGVRERPNLRLWRKGDRAAHSGKQS
jgi:H+/Cl- antiporter ClcA